MKVKACILTDDNTGIYADQHGRLYIYPDPATAMKGPVPKIIREQGRICRPREIVIVLGRDARIIINSPGKPEKIHWEPSDTGIEKIILSDNPKIILEED